MQYLTTAVFLVASTGMINADQYQNENHNRQMSVDTDHYDGGNEQYESPISTRHSQPLYPAVASQETKNPVIDINGETMPITIRFNTKTSLLNMVQNHIKVRPEKVQESRVVEEPNVLYLKVEKPVIQTINEIISPRRKIIRQIAATREVVKTVVAKHNGGAGNGGGGGGIDNYHDNGSYRGGSGEGGGGRNANMHLYRREDQLGSDSQSQ